MNNFNEKVNFIWSLAEILRGDFKQSEYGRVILPLTVLRRLDCVLAPTREQVRQACEHYSQTVEDPDTLDMLLRRASGRDVYFYNTSRFDFETLRADDANIQANLIDYIHSFSPDAREIMEHFDFEHYMDRLGRGNLLYYLVQRFAEIDLHPDTVSNREMGYIFEELIRRFSEQSNETAGEHFTPREVIRLMVAILFSQDREVLTHKGAVRTLYDPACGTGGMLSVAENYVQELNPDARLEVFGQELNPESYAICKADMLVKGQKPTNVVLGNSFTEDGFSSTTFDYMLTNPPFGVDWKKYQKPIEEEHKRRGHAGRFGAGTPRSSDGQLLFLQHMLSKMKPANGGSRLAIVFNGSPLFTGGAGSGESEIRRWIIENDWLEAIIALPTELFYNTGIATYIWVLTNRKVPERQGKIQLIDATEFYHKMKKSLGNKRNELGPEDIDRIANLYGDFEEGDHSKIFDNKDFGYHRIVVERPVRVNYAVTEERLARVQEERTFQNEASSRKRDPEKKRAEIEAGKRRQEAILEALRTIPPGPDNNGDIPVYRNPRQFKKELNKALKQAGLKLRSSLHSAILRGLSERDEDAEITRDSKGNPEADTDLRDYENVPLKEDIEAYFQREVKPYVPDAWIDESRTQVGYEINFNRYFYEYEAPRPLEEIEADIRELGEEINRMLGEVVG